MCSCQGDKYVRAERTGNVVCFRSSVICRLLFPRARRRKRHIQKWWAIQYGWNWGSKPGLNKVGERQNLISECYLSQAEVTESSTDGYKGSLRMFKQDMACQNLGFRGIEIWWYYWVRVITANPGDWSNEMERWRIPGNLGKWALYLF